VPAALDLADRGYVLQTGRVVLEGKSEDLRGSDLVRKATFSLVASERRETLRAAAKSSRALAGDPCKPLVEAIGLAPKLAAGHLRLAPRTPRAVLPPELAGLDHRVANRNHGSFCGSDASIRRVHYTRTILAAAARRQGKTTERGQSFSAPRVRKVTAGSAHSPVTGSSSIPTPPGVSTV
jgi:hypothetical protein